MLADPVILSRLESYTYNREFGSTRKYTSTKGDTDMRQNG